MTLFWHNHFATGYNKIGGRLNAAEGDPLPGGQVVGGCRPACAARSKCCATTRSATSATFWSTSPRTRRCWSGSTGGPTRRTKPQENFGREIMELFTMGVGHYTEADVYAAARVFTGWNLQPPGRGRRRRAALRVRLSTPASTTPARRLQLSDLCRRQPDDSGARRGRRHAGRPRLHQRAGGQSEHGTLSGDGSCTGSSSASSAEPPPSFVDRGSPSSTCRAGST